MHEEMHTWFRCGALFSDCSNTSVTWLVTNTYMCIVNACMSTCNRYQDHSGHCHGLERLVTVIRRIIRVTRVRIAVRSVIAVIRLSIALFFSFDRHVVAVTQHLQLRCHVLFVHISEDDDGVQIGGSKTVATYGPQTYWDEAFHAHAYTLMGDHHDLGSLYALLPGELHTQQTRDRIQHLAACTFRVGAEAEVTVEEAVVLMRFVFFWLCEIFVVVRPSHMHVSLK